MLERLGDGVVGVPRKGGILTATLTIFLASVLLGSLRRTLPALDPRPGSAQGLHSSLATHPEPGQGQAWMDGSDNTLPRWSCPCTISDVPWTLHGSHRLSHAASAGSPSQALGATRIFPLG